MYILVKQKPLFATKNAFGMWYVFYLQMHDQTCKTKKKIEQTKLSIILESTIEYGDPRRYWFDKTGSFLD